MSASKKLEQIKEATHEAMCDPKVGDRFQEFYCFWVYVVRVTKKCVYTMSASAPCEFPKDGKLQKWTRDSFKEYFSYKSDKLKNQYWVKLVDRENNVRGWVNWKKLPVIIF